MKKKGSRLKRRNTILTVLVIILILSLVGAILFGYFTNRDVLKGKYIEKVDITNEVISNAAVWLSSLQDSEINTEKIDEYMDDIMVDIILDMNSSGMKNGTYSLKVDQSSYDKACDLAYECLANELKDFIAASLDKVSYDLEEENTSIDELINEALGMDIKQYLLECKVYLLPSYEDICSRYEASGNYSVDDGTLKLDGFKNTPENEAGLYHYTWEDDVLTLVENNMVFEKLASDTEASN